MSANKPWFKKRLGWAGPGHIEKWLASPSKALRDTHRVRVVDARELTAEKAVERLCQYEYVCMSGIDGPNEDVAFGIQCAKEMAERCGMTATVVNGKVRVRRVKR